MQTVIRLLVFLALAGSAHAGQTTYSFNFSAGGTGSFVYDDVAMTASAAPSVAIHRKKSRTTDCG